MTVSRRTVLKLAGLAGAGIALPLGLAGCGDVDPVTGELLRSKAPLPPRFRARLPVPPVLRPSRSDGGTDYYEITAKRATASILPGLTTPIWGYNGIFPGPTIESRRGRRTVVRHVNQLPVPTSVHLHGGHTPPDSDGYPTDLIVPAGFTVGGHGGHSTMSPRDFTINDGAKEYRYPMRQRAATLWYHDHRMDFTGPQVWRGLAGFHIVRDDEDDALPLPRGAKDIPLMICDRSFEADGSFRYPSLDPSLTHEAGVTDDYKEGVLGDVVLVNGAPWPVLEVSNTRYRFRLLNASNARRYELELSPAPPTGTSFHQIGSDGGLLDRPVRHATLPIAQAERFDVVVDFSQYRVGDQVTLVNRLGDGPAGAVMRFDVVRAEPETVQVPARLADLSDYHALTESRATRRRGIEFSGGDPWEIGKKAFDVNRIDARAKLGATEIWTISSNRNHPFHIHLVQFKVLERRNGGVRPSDGGWKDTVDMTPSDRVTVIARFTGYRGKYVFHCHNLEHEDMAMMANLEVV